MWNDILHFHVHVLALGDPGQLPPVSKDDNRLLETPHIFLDEVMRQEAQSEIIAWSMFVRKGKDLYQKDGKEVKVLPKSASTRGMSRWADQVICATNATRNRINTEMRQDLFNTTNKFPLEGDKVICLHNDWDCVNARGDCLINGMTGTVSNIQEVPIKIPYIFTGKAIRADFLPDFYDDVDDPSQPDPYFRSLLLDYKQFMEGEPTINDNNYRKLHEHFNPHVFDYGYAITCWKAQGSSYPKVLVYEERFPFDPDLHKKFLYTAITRAEKKLVVIMKD